MRYRNSSRKSNRNAGFSLVELLVAVTILAIIIIPLMHLFLTSSRLNIKSRKTLRATTVAQDIMEGLKAYDIEELKSQFNNPGDGFYVINDGIVKGGVGEDTTREAAEVGTDAVSGDPNPGYYCFTMKDITLQGSEYDALIMIDGRGYEAEDASDAKKGTHTKEQNNTDASGTPKAHNNSGFAAVSAILEDKDGSHIEKSSYLTDDLKEIYNNTTLKPLFEAAGITQAADLTYKLIGGMTVSKDFILDITDDGTDADGNAKANVKVTVTYEISYGGNKETVMGVTRDPCDFVSGGRLYFFYYPLYEAVDECITVNNTANIPLNLTIAKQVYSSADDTDPFLLSDAKLNAAEKNYKITVDICGGSKDQTKIYTNLGTNLTNSTYLSGAGEPTDVPTQVTFQYNDADAAKSMNVFTLSGVRNTSLGAPGADNEITEVIYDVTVQVYQAGADFDSDSPMVSIDGSMNN